MPPCASSGTATPGITCSESVPSPKSAKIEPTPSKSSVFPNAITRSFDRPEIELGPTDEIW